jgi:hypothetical protein
LYNLKTHFSFCFLHVYKLKMSYRIEQNDNDIFFILYDIWRLHFFTIKVIWNAKIIIFSFLKISDICKDYIYKERKPFTFWELRCIIQEKTSVYSVFDNSCYSDNNANHMLLTSDFNSFGRVCICMLRYSVDEENVGDKEIEARSEAWIERFCQ